MSANGQRRKAPVLGGFRLGRLAGVDVLVHWSWFLIFFLLTWTLAQGLFLNDSTRTGQRPRPGWLAPSPACCSSVPCCCTSGLMP